jgi:ATP-dependent Clp protease protease subunit
MPSWDRGFRVGHASFSPYMPSGDVNADLLGDRIILVGGLDSEAAQAITAQLLMLERQDPGEEISLYVNSEGGPIDAALAVYDAMNLVSCPVATVCIGAARGGAALVVAAGDPGRRAALPNSRLMMRAPRGEFTGSSAEAESLAAEALRLERLVVELFSKHTGLTPDEVQEDLSRSRYLTAREAQARGLIDKVIERPPHAWRGIIK